MVHAQPRPFPVISYTIAQVIGILLVLSMVTVDFYDPTVFNQVYPSGGIQNWLGIGGALIGGSLVELLGISALLIPWFISQLPFAALKASMGTRLYHAFVVVFMLSVIQATLESLFWPLFSTRDATMFLFHSGYLGMMAASWLTQTTGLMEGSVMALLALLFSSLKIYQAMPFIATGILIQRGYMLSVMIFLLILKQLKLTRIKLNTYHLPFRRKSDTYADSLDSLSIPCEEDLEAPPAYEASSTTMTYESVHHGARLS
ncbi:MAG: DNA translocase FtsK 4TM domain-containing protein [SAR324 cluster bacterium]|nr:DNA translocase FtsK 4TM domain-containing protein [SAR324 cluster bacterium]